MWQDEDSHLTCWTKSYGKEGVEKKREGKKRDGREKELDALTSLYNFRRSDHWFLSKQEGEFFYATRASCGY